MATDKHLSNKDLASAFWNQIHKPSGFSMFEQYPGWIWYSDFPFTDGTSVILGYVRTDGENYVRKLYRIPESKPCLRGGNHNQPRFQLLKLISLVTTTWLEIFISSIKLMLRRAAYKVIKAMQTRGRVFFKREGIWCRTRFEELAFGSSRMSPLKYYGQKISNNIRSYFPFL